ncbi:MAG: hypothetical protein WA755_09190 [Candidatus Acidiferrales bacterium]
MRMVVRTYLVIVLIGTLISVPVQGASTKPLGTVTQAQATWLDRSTAAVGATVYAGDTLQTDNTGTVRLRAGLAQFYMMSASESRLEDAPQGIRASLLKGSAGFSSGAADVVELDAIDISIRSLSGQPAHGRVTIISPTELVVTSFRGPFEVSYDGDTQPVADGMSYKVSLVDDTKGNENGSGTRPAVRSRKKKLKLALWIGGGLTTIFFGTWIYEELCESPDTPDKQ